MELICIVGVAFAPFALAASHGHGKDLSLQQFMLEKGSFEEKERRERQRKCLVHAIKKYTGLAVGLASILIPAILLISSYHPGPR